MDKQLLLIKLTIINMSLQDEGEYRCNVFDEMEEEQGYAKLYISLNGKYMQTGCRFIEIFISVKFVDKLKKTHLNFIQLVDNYQDYYYSANITSFHLHLENHKNQI